MNILASFRHFGLAPYFVGHSVSHCRSSSSLHMQYLAWPGHRTFLGACPLPCTMYWRFALDTFAAAASIFAAWGEGERGALRCSHSFLRRSWKLLWLNYNFWGSAWLPEQTGKRDCSEGRGRGRIRWEGGVFVLQAKKTVNCVVCYALTRCCCRCCCRRKIQTYLIDTCENHASDVDSGKVNELCYWLACAAMRYVPVTMQRSPPPLSLSLTPSPSLSLSLPLSLYVPLCCGILCVLVY